MKTDDKSPEKNHASDTLDSSQAPADALSRTPDDLEDEKEAQTAAAPVPSDTSAKKAKKVSPVRRFLRRINVYFLIFALITIVAVVYFAVSYFNSQQAPPEVGIEPQELTEGALRDLANTDTSVGSPSQTLTIQGNAIIDGQTLARGNLNVAGNFQTGGSIQGSSLTISGDANLGSTQINSLQVAQNTAIQGNTSMRDLSVSGAASFSGAVTASQLTVSRLTLSGNGTIEIPNHLSFTGPAPGRNINPGVLGAGGSASVNGSDSSGTININTGNNPTAGCFLQITFNQKTAALPHVIISPVGSAAAQTRYYVDRNQSGFSVCTVAPAPANSAFAFDYFVTN